MKKIIYIFVILSLTGSGCFLNTQMPIDEAMQIKDETLKGVDVNYFPQDQKAVGYLSLADKPNAPGLILIHEWWGLNDSIKKLADRFAEEGYNALALDLYTGKVASTPDEARAYATEVREKMDAAFVNIQAGLDYLKNRPEVDADHLASVGWCFGGGWSYQIAKNNMGVDGSVMYYGQFAPEDDLEMMKSQILGHFGENDQSIPVEDVKTFRAKLDTLGGGHEIFIYPNSDHAFANEDGANYNSESAELAWDRTLDFLKELFK